MGPVLTLRGGRTFSGDDYKTDSLYVIFQTPVQDERSCQVRPEQGFKYALCTPSKGILTTTMFFWDNYADI